MNGNVKQAACGGSQWRMGPTFFKCFLLNIPPYLKRLRAIKEKDNEMWVRASLCRRFTDINVHGTDSVKVWKTRHKISVDIRIFCAVRTPIQRTAQPWQSVGRVVEVATTQENFGSWVQCFM